MSTCYSSLSLSCYTRVLKSVVDYDGTIAEMTEEEKEPGGGRKERTRQTNERKRGKRIGSRSET